MLKHMLTQTTSHPRTRDSPRAPAKATVVGIPTMEDLRQHSPLPPPLETRRGRPVSVHGNVLNQSTGVYVNAPMSKQQQQRLNQSLNGQLNLSNLNSSNASPGTSNQTKTTLTDSSRDQSLNHDLSLTGPVSPIARTTSLRHHNLSATSNGEAVRLNSTANGGLNLTQQSKRLNASMLPANVSKFMLLSKEAGVKPMITSLGLLCLVSLLLALLSLVFLFKISPVNAQTKSESRQYDFLSREEYEIVYEVTLAMCCLALSLNLCCLLVCAIQFLFAIKLVNQSVHGRARTTRYLKEASATRIFAIGGFFVSIPVFLTGIILYTFLHFDSTPAIITSILIGLGIVFCGAAVVHNVFVWQKEKTSSRHLQMQHMSNKNSNMARGMNQKSLVGLPQATLDLSGQSARGLELSTLV